jgi:hypothetical protein
MKELWLTTFMMSTRFKSLSASMLRQCKVLKTQIIIRRNSFIVMQAILSSKLLEIKANRTPPNHFCMNHNYHLDHTQHKHKKFKEMLLSGKLTNSGTQ